VAGTDFDQVLLTGALSLSGTFNIDALGGYDLELPGSFQLFDGFTSRSGNFAAVNVGATPLAFSATSWKGTQNLAQFDFDIDSGVLTVSAIPEPGTLGLLLVSGLALVLALRRRRA